MMGASDGIAWREDPRLGQALQVGHMLEATWWILPAAPHAALAHGVRQGFAEVMIVTGSGLVALWWHVVNYKQT